MAWTGYPKPEPKRSKDNEARGSFVFKEWQQAHIVELCNCCHSAGDGRKDKHVGM